MRTLLAPRWLRNAGLASLLLVPLLGTSCSRRTGVPVYPVHGRVLYRGKPLPGAFVIFHSLEEESHPRPLGYAEADGSFTLTTYQNGDGAPAGDYAVTVEWRKPPLKDNDPPPHNLLPARYARPNTSGLHRRVESGSNELPPIQLR